MAEIRTYSNNIYWTYRIEDLFWCQLEKNFNTKKFYISSFKSHAVRKGDIILIFKTHKSPTKTGFVAVCQVETDMTHNSSKIKIFNDTNMNKFYCELSSVFLFDEPYKLSKLKDDVDDFNSTLFRKNFIGNNSMFVKLTEKLTNDIVPFITEYVPEPEASFLEEDDDIYENENNEIEKETEEEIEEDDDDYDIQVSLGHFPILFDPANCKKFKKGSSKDITINNVKHHFENCEGCERCDNNEISVISKFKKGKFHLEDIEDENEANELIEHYQGLKRWKLEVSGDDRKHDNIFIKRIAVPTGHLYNDSYIILW